MKIIQIQYSDAQGVLYGLGDDGWLYRCETKWNNTTRKHVNGWVAYVSSDDVIE